MTDAEKQTRDFLALLHRVHVQNNTSRPKHWVYDGPADLLVREGKPFKPGTLVHWPHSVKQACFRNAAMYAIDHKLRYVEGYAVSIIPVHHAWCADKDDNVIEVTWDKVGTGYFGVEFPPMKVTKGSVLFNYRNRSIYMRRVMVNSQPASGPARKT